MSETSIPTLAPANPWSNWRVLVTGATGLVGGWLVKDLLARNATVVALVLDPDPQTELYRSGDWQRIHIARGSLEDYDSLVRVINGYEIDTVMHLGAQTIVGTANRAPLGTFEANIRGSYNLLEACRVLSKLVKRVVVASSDKAYGDHATLPYREDAPLRGRHPYDVSKSCTDLIAQTYAHTYQLPVSIARCGNIFGGGDLNWSRIVPGTIRSLLSNQRPIIRSDGQFVRDYVYVRDVARAYMKLAEHVEQPGVTGQAYNFGWDAPVTVIQLVTAITQLMGRDDLAPVILNQASGEIRSQYLASDKARAQLNWKPEFDLRTGLRETIAWYQAFLKN